jgi:hypothetical protein
VSDDDPFGVEKAICPVTPAPTSPLDVSVADVAQGQAELSAITGMYLPPAGQEPGGRGATVISGGGGTPIVSRDVTGNGANVRFGWLGEQGAAFAYGLMGYDVVAGPSGAGGKSTSASGEDMLLFHPQTRTVPLNDNKQSAKAQPVGECQALNEHLLETVTGARDRASASTHPDKDFIVQTLEQFRLALTDPANHPVPDAISLRVSNAGGCATDISKGLKQSFAGNWGTPRYADGRPLELTFDNLQPPETLREVTTTVNEVVDRGQPPVPTYTYATPTDALGVPWEAPVTRGEPIGPAVAQAGPLLVDWLTSALAFALPRLGAKDAPHREIEAVVTKEVLPHLKTDPSLGALFMVTLQTVTMNDTVAPSTTVVSVLPFYATTNDEAYEQRLRQSMFQAVLPPNAVRHEQYYWYKDAKLTDYFPGRSSPQ